MHVRRRGTAIVEDYFGRGILVVNDVSGKKPVFILPGGGVKPQESREDAAIRELREETNLYTISCKYLFRFQGPVKKEANGHQWRQDHKVYLIHAVGLARPGHGVKAITWYKPGQTNITVATSYRQIIARYYMDHSAAAQKT